MAHGRRQRYFHRIPALSFLLIFIKIYDIIFIES
nr:MAG TPA: hypothetical protein [Caudoviricetes sp.]